MAVGILQTIHLTGTTNLAWALFAAFTLDCQRTAGPTFSNRAVLLVAGLDSIITDALQTSLGTEALTILVRLAIDLTGFGILWAYAAAFSLHGYWVFTVQLWALIGCASYHTLIA